ncbi:DNA-binding transcriptional regulator, MarR family [Paractinoplanes atraurantiacus]|uniref:DNA-binding transcriptional regulator, MarR family n=1 Tax=Paractinoplanes atraurantiacus TaxID=1036182 RepID=A0A285KSI7_9ACTN|nr:DNA-binding transcriptional regulator, MarR family [Actinoplanes atraurantiacus]
MCKLAGVSERLENLTTRALSMAAMRSDRVVNERLAGAGSRKWHYAVLAALDESGPASQAELSRATGIYRSDIVAVVNELADRALVERSPDPADRRRNVVTLTAAGRRKLVKLDLLLRSVQDEVFAELTRAERDQLVTLLAKVGGPDSREH